MPVASRACKANCLLTFLNVTSGRKQKPISLKIELLQGWPMKWWPIKWKRLLWALTINVAALRRAQWSAVYFGFSRGPEVWYLSKHQIIKAFLLCLISHGRPTPRAQIFSALFWSSIIISLSFCWPLTATLGLLLLYFVSVSSHLWVSATLTI